MSAGDSDTLTMRLVAYELLTEHGLALPLFGSSAGANALHIAVPSLSGDPFARVQAFDVYPASAARPLDMTLQRTIAVGSVWIDVFIWKGVVHVGSRAELWEATGSVHEEMSRTAPLTLLALAEGAGREESARSAALVHRWLARNWGAERADKWRLGSYLFRLARRDIARYFEGNLTKPTARAFLQTMNLVQREAVLELRSQQSADFKAVDLPELLFAVGALGWRLEIDSDVPEQTISTVKRAELARMLVMRLRHGRGQTQTQIPLRVFDSFFDGNRNVTQARTGRSRTMTLSRANGVRNTMKLQLPELARMSDPVAQFERTDAGVYFEIYDSASPEGRRIAELLDQGLGDGTTSKTQGGATWWRVLP